MITWDLYFQLIRFIIIFDAFILCLAVYFGWWRKRGRILVRVRTPLGQKKHWKKPEEDGKTIIMYKARGRKPGWKFTFSNKSIFWVKRIFGLVKTLCLDVMYNASEAVNWDFDLKQVDMPKWDKKTSKEWIEAETLRKRATGLKYPMPSLFWLILILQIVLIVFSFIILQRLGLRL